MKGSKTLYLVRHAKSSWSAADLSDFDRPLNKRGFRDAPEMGRRLKADDSLPALICCSPATRARQTLEEMNLDTKTVFDERLYGASREELLEIVRSTGNEYPSLMLIGHNPAMTWLANDLSGARIDNMPTCSIAIIRLPDALWAQAGTAPAELVAFDYPKRPA